MPGFNTVWQIQETPILSGFFDLSSCHIDNNFITHYHIPIPMVWV